MARKYSDKKSVKLIYEDLQKLKRGETSFEAFAVGVALVIDPTPLTPSDIEWAQKTTKSLGFEVNDPIIPVQSTTGKWVENANGEEIKCIRCRGTGVWDYYDNPVPCPDCDAKGVLACPSLR